MTELRKAISVIEKAMMPEDIRPIYDTIADALIEKLKKNGNKLKLLSTYGFMTGKFHRNSFECGFILAGMNLEKKIMITPGDEEREAWVYLAKEKNGYLIRA